MTIRTDRSLMSKLHLVAERLLSQPRRVRILLDLVFVVTAVAAFAQVWDPDVLFHLIWVILTIEAFLFGLRLTAARIAVAMLLLLAYFNLGSMAGPTGPNVAALDLAEWPLMVVIAAIVAVMADRVAATSRQYAELYRRASDRLLTAQEDERKRLGRDLHDGVGQTLTAVVLTLDAAESQMWAGERAPSTLARAAILRAQELAAIALDETRDVAYRLRPDRFVETGLVAATNRLAASAGVPITVVAPADLAVPGLLDPEDEMNVYRIVQEAVSNAIRHARAKHIRIEFESLNGELTVSVTDDGVGFEPGDAEERGLGVAGMRERALILRSGLDVRSVRGVGTRVSITVTLHHRPETSPSPSIAGIAHEGVAR